MEPFRTSFRTVLGLGHAWLAALVVSGLCACGAGESAVYVNEPAPVAAPVAQTTAPTSTGSSAVVSVPKDTADDPAQSRSTLQGTIEEAIVLLRARQYRTLIEQFVDPVDLAKFKARSGGVESLVKEFADSDKPQVLLDTLISVRSGSPELSDDGDEATYQADPTAGAPDGGKVRFHRVDERWYLRN